MEMQIEVSKVSPVRMEGKYAKMDVHFIREGKSSNRTIAGVGKSKDVLNVLKEANPGDLYDIELVKSADDKYWNWEGAKKAEKQVEAAAAKTSYQTKSTYETPEERAKKQVYIIRQSSLSNAIEYLTAQGKKYSPAEVFDHAQNFVDFVFQTERMDRVAKIAEKAAERVEDMQDDIPF